MVKSASEIEQQVYRRMFEFSQQLEEEGIHIDELARGVAGFLASIVFESTPSSLVLTSFSGVNDEHIENKVFTGLHTPDT